MEQRTVGFEADYEKLVVAIENDGRRTESRELYRLYQDSRGRTRMQGSIPAGQGETLRLAWITDRRRGQSIVLDLATGKPVKFRPFRPPDRPAAAPTRGPGAAPAEPEAQTRQDLGEAEIEGLRARGWRTTSPSFGVSEVWQATLIDQPPLLVKSKRPDEERTERLFNLRIGEPDPQLFAPLDAPEVQNP